MHFKNLSLKHYVGATVILLVALALVSLLGLFHFPLSAQVADSEIITLNPLGSFVAPGGPDARIAGVESGEHSVWFLLAHPGSSEVQQADATGIVQNTIDVTGSSQPVKLSISRDGRIAVQYRGTGINIYSQSGALIKSVPSTARGLDSIFVENSLIGIGMHHVVEFQNEAVERDITTIAEPPASPRLSVALPNARVGIIDTRTATLNVLDTQSGSLNKIQLVAPEIQGINRFDPHVMSIFSATVDPASNDFYVATGPFNARSGASILRFTAEGVLKERLRLVLPQLSALKTEKVRTGQFLFKYMAIAGDSFVLVSSSQRYCVYYKLQ